MIVEPIARNRPVAGDWRIEPLLPPATAPAGPVRGGALPPALARRYGSDLAIALRPDNPTIVANFVTTIDGVVALDTEGRTGGREISGAFEPDRFLMGLLRATADAVLVGGGTVRSGAGHVWTPDHVHSPSAVAYGEWRRALGLSAPQPTTVMVSGSGRIDPDHPALHRPDVPVLIATTTVGARRLGRAARQPNVELAVIADAGQEVGPTALRSLLKDRHLEVVVCEGGPTLFGGLLGAGLIDELFLTVAPQLAGRTPAMPRLSLVEGLGFDVGAAPWAALGSVLRSGSHLFLRYWLTDPIVRS
jgi:riboflavin biosynthesis pyrimidine reductase